MQGRMSFEQRKRVSIALELAANPAIMFLDEPTTGLDARSAEVVIHNIRTIAKTGRTIVCTIHQPSPSVFFAFDKLLLLKKGGRVVYFGDVGAEANAIVQYFESIPGCLSLQDSPCKKSPAMWMLECIGAGTANATHEETTGSGLLPDCTSASMDDHLELSSDNQLNLQTFTTTMSLTVSDFDVEHTSCGTSPAAVVDYCEVFAQSKVFEENREYLSFLTASFKAKRPILEMPQNSVSHATASSKVFSVQIKALFERTWRSYWRNPGYNFFVRIVLNLVLSLIFASFYVQYECETTSQVISFVTVQHYFYTICASEIHILFSLEFSLPVALLI
jgi:energy-coupling factor transporter ATP-binding protein EcfA2